MFPAGHISATTKSRYEHQFGCFSYCLGASSVLSGEDDRSGKCQARKCLPLGAVRAELSDTQRTWRVLCAWRCQVGRVRWVAIPGCGCGRHLGFCYWGLVIFDSQNARRCIKHAGLILGTENVHSFGPLPWGAVCSPFFCAYIIYIHILYNQI